MENTVWFLLEYRWLPGKLLPTTSAKNYKIKYSFEGRREETRLVPKEKCALEDELVCVVWEEWRGCNGRGGYRLEREMYPEHRIPAQNVRAGRYVEGPQPDKSGTLAEPKEKGVAEVYEW